MMSRFPQSGQGKGSLRDIQVLLNDFPQLANQMIAAELGWSEAPEIEWVSPVAADEFAEYRDGAFLEKLGLDYLKPALADFWPANGPQWDALGRAADGSVFLVEAKANIPEAVSPGTGAKEGSPSRGKINAALAETRQFVGAKGEGDWSRTFYQHTNRLAHLHFLRKQDPPINAYLVFIYFVGDTSVAGPGTKEEWFGAVKIIKNYLGLDRKHRLAPRIVELYVDVEGIKRRDRSDAIEPTSVGPIRRERGKATATLSIDLAYKDYADIGIVSIRRAADRIVATPWRLAKRGLRGRPALTELADALEDIAGRVGATRLMIDGPQAWKCPNNGEIHARKCERELATQGKTGLPGITKPSNYLGFITFAIDLFDELDVRGWPRLDDISSLVRPSRLAIESFPTAAWRALGLTPLPGKSKAQQIDISAKLNELRSLFPLDVPDDLTHDELQALVSGLAGFAFDGEDDDPSALLRDNPDDVNPSGFQLAGIAPYVLDEIWREGYIVNPIRKPRTKP